MTNQFTKDHATKQHAKIWRSAKVLVVNSRGTRMSDLFSPYRHISVEPASLASFSSSSSLGSSWTERSCLFDDLAAKCDGEQVDLCGGELVYSMFQWPSSASSSSSSLEYNSNFLSSSFSFASSLAQRTHSNAKRSTWNPAYLLWTSILLTVQN